MALAPGANHTERRAEPPQRPPRRVLVWARTDRRDANEAAAQACGWLTERGVEVLRAPAGDTPGTLSSPSGAAMLARADLALIFGGDGAVVSAARRSAPWGTPVIGVNYGTFGFLALIEANELHAGLEALLAGDYEVDQRLMLAAGIGDASQYVAANDVVIHAAEPGRMLELVVRLGDEPVVDLPADGLIIATPTGSTAYNLSAGGPVVMPTLAAMVMTPICPHTLAARPLLLGGESQLSIEVLARPRLSQRAIVTLDGQISFDLEPGVKLHVCQAESTMPFVRLRRDTFFASLRGKLGWGRPK